MPSFSIIKIHKAITDKVDSQVANIIADFVEYVIQDLELERPVTISLLPKSGATGEITTGGYQPSSGTISSRLEGRALVDVMRTIAHEMVHQNQDERGCFDSPDYVHQNIGGEMEDEANAVAGQLIKKYVRDRNNKFIYNL